MNGGPESKTVGEFTGEIKERFVCYDCDGEPETEYGKGDCITRSLISCFPRPSLPPFTQRHPSLRAFTRPRSSGRHSCRRRRRRPTLHPLPHHAFPQTDSFYSACALQSIPVLPFPFLHWRTECYCCSKTTQSRLGNRK